MRRTTSGIASRAQGTHHASRPGAVQARLRAHSAELRLEQRAVILNCPGRSGLTLRVAVPLAHYRGVSADIKLNDDGLKCEIILAHEDPDFDVKLFSAIDDENVLAEWHGWSRELHLPLMIRTEDGDIFARGQLGSLAVEPASPRRVRRLFLARRPRFLRRRKSGRAEVSPRIHREREIIARN